MAYNVYTGITKSKRKLTEKQKQALAKGRETADINARKRQYQRALQMQINANPDKDLITFERFEARIRYTMREQNLSRKQALKKITTSRMFRTQEELFKMAVKSYAQLSDFTKIRSYIWTILKEQYPDEAKNGMITYNTTKIDWDEFVYDDFLKALVYERNGRKIIIKVKHGKDSMDLDWLSIELL